MKLIKKIICKIKGHTFGDTAIDSSYNVTYIVGGGISVSSVLRCSRCLVEINLRNLK